MELHGCREFEFYVTIDRVLCIRGIEPTQSPYCEHHTNAGHLVCVNQTVH